MVAGGTHAHMSHLYDVNAPKRAVNMTLNEDLVSMRPTSPNRWRSYWLTTSALRESGARRKMAG